MRKRLGAVFLAMLLLFITAVPASAAALSINKNSITLQSEDSFQLSVLENGAAVQAQAWGSSDSSVASVSQNGLVTGKKKGSAVITAMRNGKSVECLVSVVEKAASATVRYSVLVLDASGSVKGKALKREKEAAKRFCKTILNAKGNNYLAVVSLGSSGKVVSGFTNSQAQLIKAINSLRAGGGTNMNQAFQKAGDLLDGVKGGSKVIKNIVLCSDGLPEDGAKQAKGRYRKKDHKFYKYANAVYKTDVKLKKKNYFVYALGFFHNSGGKDLKFGKKLMRDLASRNKYYIVTKPKDIDKVFRKIANVIKKTTKNKKQKTVKKKSKSKIRLNKSALTIYVGQTAKLKASVKGKSKKVKWRSANSSIAKVNKKGKVTGVKPGQVKITAKANGKKAVCIVKVIMKHPTYSQYFMVNSQKSKYGSATINEYGIRLVTNKEAVIKKCAVYVKRNSDGSYSRTMACTGNNITYAYAVPYLAYNGTIYYEGGKTPNINRFSLRKGSSGVWSRYGSYSTINANLKDAGGNELAIESIGVFGQNTKIFEDLSAMKAWLEK